LLVKNFDDLFNETYTARMEHELDEIEEGKLKWTDALREFYDKFAVDLENAEREMKAAKRQAIPTDEVCEKCGATMVIKLGRLGQFLAGWNWPGCTNTRDLEKPAGVQGDGRGGTTASQAGREMKEAAGAPEDEAEIEPCERCGEPMVLKRGRYGP